MNKKLKISITAIVLLLVTGSIILIISRIHIRKEEREEYSRCVDENQDSDLASSDPYTTGYNRDGRLMYRDPKAAFAQIQSDYAEEIVYIKAHSSCSNLTYMKGCIEGYRNVSWQIDTTFEGQQKSQEIAKDLIRLSQKLSMLLNSFE